MADALDLTLCELVDFDVTPAAVAESAEKYDAPAGGGKVERGKPVRRATTKRS